MQQIGWPLADTEDSFATVTLPLDAKPNEANATTPIKAIFDNMIHL
jgi:hypothetical protein